MPEPSARQRLIWLKPWDWSEEDITQRVDAYRDEVQAKTRRDVARFVREAMVSDPAGEAEDHLNDCLARLAHEIEGGAL
jgi:hypothetical protein